MINLTTILKDVPKGTSLYSPVCGSCQFQEVSNNIISVKADGLYSFDEKGCFCEKGERLLFPSKEMKYWDKFAWKKGYVLFNPINGKRVIFNKFTNDTYLEFSGSYLDQSELRHDVFPTSTFEKAPDKFALEYINKIEVQLGGIFNPETLTVERKFKPFDKVLVRDYREGFWRADFFSHAIPQKNGKILYVCVGDSWYQCLPYNEETAKLIGTDLNYE